MIRSFGGKDPERIWHEQYVKSVDRTVQRATLRKLELIHAAKEVEDLRIPPGSRLARYFGTSEEFWMNLQSNYELRLERHALRERFRRSHRSWSRERGARWT